MLQMSGHLWLANNTGGGGEYNLYSIQFSKPTYWPYKGFQNMYAKVTIQIQNKHKGKFSTRSLDDSKDGLLHEKCNYVSIHHSPHHQ